MDEKDKELQELRRQNEELRARIERYEYLLAGMMGDEAKAPKERTQTEPWEE